MPNGKLAACAMLPKNVKPSVAVEVATARLAARKIRQRRVVADLGSRADALGVLSFNGKEVLNVVLKIEEGPVRPISYCDRWPFR